ncbi:MAG: ATP-binding protein [Saprospiraceae bacterium]
MKRKIFTKLLEHLPDKEATILIGARQTGKSTLLRQVREHLEAQGETVQFFNLERRELLTDLNANPENIFKYLPVQKTGRAFVLIDEVQYLQDPTHFVKLLYDEYSDRIKLLVTGSSAFYIDDKFKDSLAGRKKIFELKTLDFEEYLLFSDLPEELSALQKLRDSVISASALEPRLWVHLENYMTYGGYPAVVLEPDYLRKQERLAELRDSFVKRDMLESGIADEFKFYRLLMLLASQTGGMVNLSELSNTLQVSQHHLSQYLFVLQKCFHISLVRPFARNLRKELTKMPKVYFNDLGLRNALVNYYVSLESRADKGLLLENYVFRQLSERHTLDQIKYWRTADGNEVDFVLEENAYGGKAVEVKFNRSEYKPRKYARFVESYPEYPLEVWSWKERALLG